MRSSEANRIYFDRAADQLDLSENIRQLLLTPRREVQVQLPVELDRSLAIVCNTTMHAGQ
jgi:glutamate dehydrogenase (NAD(P)+)